MFLFRFIIKVELEGWISERGGGRILRIVFFFVSVSVRSI